MNFRDMRRASLTMREWRKVISESPIWKIALTAKVATWSDIAEEIRKMLDGLSDILHGLSCAGMALAKILWVILQYATWPISKPIVSAYWRAWFRRSIRAEQEEKTVSFS